MFTSYENKDMRKTKEKSELYLQGHFYCQETIKRRRLKNSKKVTA
jgi:hypothetical protein